VKEFFTSVFAATKSRLLTLRCGGDLWNKLRFDGKKGRAKLGPEAKSLT
jgi:hypothetical protein